MATLPAPYQSARSMTLIKSIVQGSKRVLVHFHDDWNEKEHPRAKSGKHPGQFTKKGTEGTVSYKSVHNALHKVLKEQGYSGKQKSSTTYTHPAKGNIEVYPAAPGQQWISGWHHPKSGKSGSGAGKLEAHLNSLKEGEPPLGGPLAPATAPASAPKATPHPSNKVHKALTQMGFEPILDNESNITYKEKGGEGLLKVDKKINNNKADWVYYATSGSNGVVGSGINNGSLAKAITNKKALPEASNPKESEQEPQATSEQAKLSKSQLELYSLKTTIKWQGDNADYYKANSGEVIVIGTGATNKNKWSILTPKVGVVATGVGQKSLNEAFEKLHPRDENGKFIAKPKEAEPKAPEPVVPTTKPKEAEPKAPEPVVPTTKQSNIGNVLHQPDLVKIGNQKGSNPGGVYQDLASGQEYYLKEPKTNAHAKNELLAAALMHAAGGSTLDYHEVVNGDKLNIATDYKPLEKDNMYSLTPEQKKKAQEDFALNVWIANWDAAGLTGDNIGVVDGKVVNLDLGGSLFYRAQGSPKEFNSDPKEWKTLRDASMNTASAYLYGEMTATQLKQSADKLWNIDAQQITDLVNRFSPSSDPTAKQTLVATLIARKNAIITLADAAANAPVTEHKAGVGTKNNKGEIVVSPTEPNKSYSTVYDNLTQEAPEKTSKESNVIESYTGIGYHEINNCLRYVVNCDHIPGTIEIRSWLNRASTSKPLTLFRGINSQYSNAVKAQIGAAKKKGVPLVLHDGGFLSISTSRSVAEGFAHGGGDNGLIFIIEVPEGSKGASVDNTSESEYEVLFQQGSRLRVTGEKDPLTGYYKAILDQSHMIENEKQQQVA